jgi:riboflavin kinase/FMN adenylyltransferase
VSTMKVVYGLDELAGEYPSPVLTVGNFDGVHLGHQTLMRDIVARAANIGGTPAVITFDPHPLQVLAPNNAPLQIQTLRQKLATIEALGIVLVIVIPFSMPLAQIEARDFAIQTLWEKLKPKEIYVGPNFAFGHRREGSFNLLKEIGEEKGFWVGKAHQVQFRGSRVSSTSIRQALLSGQVGLARRLLNRPYELEGSVVHGTGLGTKIQVPTANLKTPNELIPRRGVYVTLISIGGRKHKSVTNIGVRPTIVGGEAAALGVETHVLDFDRTIYGKEVGLEFLFRLRDEKRFSGIDALVEKMQIDIANSRRFFHHLDRACRT